MAEIWTMGEMIVEIMREKENEPLDKAGVFRGPYPSGAPAIFIDTVARLGHKGGIIGGVGKDDFGKCLLDRLKSDGVDVSHVIENPKKATGCAIVTYFDDGSRKFIFHMGNTPAVEAKAPQKDVLDGVRYFHVMGCSLFADIEFAKEILKDCNLYSTSPTLIACPTCGRTQIDLIPIAKEIEEFLQTIQSNIKVAVMGCAVNGPGEAREADIGIAGGIKEGLLFKKGEIIRKIPQDEIVEELKKEILKMVN